MMPVHKRKTVRGTERRSGAPRGGRPAWTFAQTAQACLRRTGREGARSRPAGLRHWPALTGAAAPERLSALRPLTLCEGIWQTSEGKCLARTMMLVCNCRVGHKGVYARLRRAMGASSRRAHVNAAATAKQDVGTLRFAHPTFASSIHRHLRALAVAARLLPLHHAGEDFFRIEIAVAVEQRIRLGGADARDEALAQAILRKTQ